MSYIFLSFWVSRVPLPELNLNIHIVHTANLEFQRFSILFSKIMRFCTVQTPMQNTLDKKFRTACFFRAPVCFHWNIFFKHAVLNFLSSVIFKRVCTAQKRMILLNNIIFV